MNMTAAKFIVSRIRAGHTITLTAEDLRLPDRAAAKTAITLRQFKQRGRSMEENSVWSKFLKWLDKEKLEMILLTLMGLSAISFVSHWFQGCNETAQLRLQYNTDCNSK